MGLKLSRAALVLVMLSFVSIAHAEKIYHWRDSAGQVHYSNHPALVPSQRGAVDIIEMKDDQPMLRADVVAGINQSGQLIWETYCASCHHIGRSWKNGLRGLPDRMLAQALSFEDMKGILKYATDGDLADMDGVELSAEELTALTAYVMQEAEHK